MDHSLYRPEDFACDESYLRYYFKLSEKDIGYWESWIRTHPEKLDVIMSADQLIGFLSLQLPEEEFQHEYDRFTRAIAKSALVEVSRNIEIQPLPRVQPRKKRRTGIWLALASVLLVTGSAWLFEYHSGPKPSAGPLSGPLLTRTNTGAAAIALTLEDGSQVKLEPGAQLSWPAHFQAGKREVTLDGDASFQVSKNPHHPFFVYCHNLVVRVLGTGFVVTVNKKDNTIEVTVSSGNVEVYEKQKVAGGVVLTPNQKLIYAISRREFETTLADKPLPIAADTSTGFSNARLYDVIRSLQRMYGIDIEVEDETIYNCRFSGRLDNRGFYEALGALCRPLNMTYEIKETKILLRGAGCDAP